MNWYQLPTKAGKTMAVEIVAGRVGSGADPFVELWDANGKRIQFQEDAPGAGVDCRWELGAAEERPLWLSVRDTGYAGGLGMDYWVRIS